MRNSARIFVTLLAAGCAAPAFASQNALFSPWDTHAVTASDAPYACGLPKQLSPFLTILNRDYRTGMTAASEDVKDAAGAEAVTSLDDLVRRVVKAADTYQRTGSVEAARCVVTLLSAAAADRALTMGIDNAELFYQQMDKLRAYTIAYLKVRNAGAASPDQREQIVRWMKGLAAQERVFYGQTCKREPCRSDNQQGLQAGYAVASVGIAANDRDLFYWGLGKYRKAVKQIEPNGMLATVKPSDRMLKFNLESAAALVLLAEYGELNGEHLYQYDHGSIHLLVHTATRGLVDPTPFMKANGGKAQIVPDSIEGWQIAWATIYATRFDDPVIVGLLAQMNAKGLDAWGGEPFRPQVRN